MTLKCGKNKKVAHKAIAESANDAYHILLSSVIYYQTDTRQQTVYTYKQSFPSLYGFAFISTAIAFS